MSHALQPYIGITDFMTFTDVQVMYDDFKAHTPLASNRILHVGVMMSYKTLKGHETKWSKAFPPKEQIAGIFGSDDVLNCLHYADYAQEDEQRTNYKDLAEAIGYGGVGIHALQLDMPWPDPVMIANAIHTSRKNLEVILQVGKVSIEMVQSDPVEVVRWLEQYEGIIHRVLLDMSMGRGKEMNAQFLLPYLYAINERYPELGLVVAGGLGPDRMHLVEPIVRAFPDVSIDAQSKLRPSGSALDPIDWSMAKDYIEQVFQILR
jgi:hypothetical protein